MAMVDFYPHEFIEETLKNLGIDLNKILTSSGTIRKQQLKLFQQLSDQLGINIPLLDQLYELDGYNKKLDKQVVEDSINASLITAEMRLQNTATWSLMNSTIYNENIVGQNTKITWLPSDAEHARIEHGRHYGKTYTLAQAKKLGLGVDYGCRCGFKIKSGQYKKIQSDIKQQFKGLI